MDPEWAQVHASLRRIWNETNEAPVSGNYTVSHVRGYYRTTDDRRSVIRFIPIVLALVLGTFLLPRPADAACIVPNQINNGQTADAAVVMDNFNALKDCADAAVLPSGTPAAGNLPVFSGPKAITGGNLSGDCTTAGSLSVTCTKTNGVSFGPLATGTDAGQLTGTISVNRFGNGVGADVNHFLRGDGVWAAPPGGGGSGGCSAWTQVGSWTWSTNVPYVDFTGLAAYNELIFIARGVTLSASTTRALQVSVDNGATFFATSGNYITVDAAGVEPGGVAFAHSTGTTRKPSAQSEATISPTNSSGAPPVCLTTSPRSESSTVKVSLLYLNINQFLPIERLGHYANVRNRSKADIGILSLVRWS